LVTGLRQPKLQLLTSLVLASSTPVELIGSSVHSAEDICEIGWMETSPNKNIRGIFQTVRSCVEPVTAMFRLFPLQRLEFEPYSVMQISRP